MAWWASSSSDPTSLRCTAGTRWCVCSMIGSSSSILLRDDPFYSRTMDTHPKPTLCPYHSRIMAPGLNISLISINSACTSRKQRSGWTSSSSHPSTSPRVWSARARSLPTTWCDACPATRAPLRWVLSASSSRPSSRSHSSTPLCPMPPLKAMSTSTAEWYLSVYAVQ